jgi:hypothetical protein
MSKKQFENSLDELFKNAAEKYAEPFNQEAWLKMEALLNKPTRRRVGIIWWLAFMLILVGAGAYFTFVPQTNAVAKESNQLKGLLPPAAAAEPQQNSNEAAYPSTRNNIIGKNNTFQASTASNNLHSDAAFLQTKVKPLGVVGNSSNVITTIEDLNTSVSIPNTVLKQSNTGIQDQHIDKKLSLLPTDTALISTTTFGLSQQTQKVNGIDTPFVSSTPASANISLVVPDTISTIAKNNFSLKTSKWSFGIVLGADVNTVGKGVKGSLSHNFGLTISYQFNRRWSINTGLLLANKIYNADSADYTQKDDYNWLSRVDAVKNIAANCKVIEIPIQLGYQFKGSKKGNFALYAGFSTYFMNSEEYQYECMVQGSARDYWVAYYNNNQHLFSIANIAIARNWYFKNNFCLQLAPYARIPLKGVGQGQMQLNSYGLQIGIQWMPKPRMK